jgi:hypothetical protein
MRKRSVISTDMLICKMHSALIISLPLKHIGLYLAAMKTVTHVAALLLHHLRQVAWLMKIHGHPIHPRSAAELLSPKPTIAKKLDPVREQNIVRLLALPIVPAPLTLAPAHLALMDVAEIATAPEIATTKKSHHKNSIEYLVSSIAYKTKNTLWVFFLRFVRLAGIEPATFWTATRRSIH